MFRTIVVAHDGTRSGDKALDLALQLRPRDGRLVLAAVHPAAPYTLDSDGPGSLVEEYRDRAGAALLRAAADAIPEDVPFRCETMAATSPRRGLTQLAESESADLLVVGPSHRRRLGRARHNTTGQRVLHDAPCAVAVATRRSRQIHRIGVAYDGSPESELALEAGRELARGLEATLVLFGVTEPPLLDGGVAVPVAPGAEAAARRETDAQLSAAADRRPPDVAVSRQTLVGRASEILPRLALPDVDLMVTGSRGHGPLRRVLIGSVSAALIGADEVPVVVTPRRIAAPTGAAVPSMTS